jgi:hypothetical protein
VAGQIDRHVIDPAADITERDFRSSCSGGTSGLSHAASLAWKTATSADSNTAEIPRREVTLLSFQSSDDALVC